MKSKIFLYYLVIISVQYEHLITEMEKNYSDTFESHVNTMYILCIY